MVRLSAAKRAAYAVAQPTFWRPAPRAEELQQTYFGGLVARADVVALVGTVRGVTVGFVIGELRRAPPVYDPGGLTCLVDDFCVESGRWEAVGALLLGTLKERAAERGAVQVVVVCGAHDVEKSALLARAGLTAASTWYVGPA